MVLAPLICLLFGGTFLQVAYVLVTDCPGLSQWALPLTASSPQSAIVGLCPRDSPLAAFKQLERFGYIFHYDDLSPLSNHHNYK